MTPTPEEILRTATPFNALPEGDRHHLAAVTEVKSFAAGETIFREADPSEFLYTIVSGRAKVFKMTSSGKDIILGIDRASWLGQRFRRPRSRRSARHRHRQRQHPRGGRDAASSPIVVSILE